jgi:hypothetical protein
MQNSKIHLVNTFIALKHKCLLFCFISSLLNSGIDLTAVIRYIHPTHCSMLSLSYFIKSIWEGMDIDALLILPPFYL